ncbi:MAG: hypothetical protein ABI947_21825 [Chloroflexota bacterium]
MGKTIVGSTPTLSAIVPDSLLCVLVPYTLKSRLTADFSFSVHKLFA